MEKEGETRDRDRLRLSLVDRRTARSGDLHQQVKLELRFSRPTIVREEVGLKSQGESVE